ncbi:PREDICTED: cytochrome P450 84A4-like [Camelina sativa]|uniref:Cytochrome P450 84A4-like n=1 Tax=Camelina sativa TaxID=90675 RepID=A0ABM0VHW5_CAMSA|nr:PREDICTED: cytochrome P450 84A4-like [Camelina sativa]
MHTLTILIFLVPLLLFLFRHLLSRRRRLTKPYPPGPKGLPIIGNILMMNHFNHRGLAKLSRIYGGLLHLRLGFSHVFVVSSPDIARQVLQVQHHVFSNRPTTIAIRYLTYGGSDLAFCNYGPFWRRMRKLFVMMLFSRKRAESWVSVDEEVHKSVRFVAVNVGKPLNVCKLAFSLTRDITFRAAFGSSSSTSDEERLEEFLEIIQEFSKLFGEFNVADYVPSWLSWIDPQGINKRVEKARKSLDCFIESVIDDHLLKKTRERNVDDEENDMVDQLLAFNKEEIKVNNSETNIKLNNIKGIIMDVMFGGTETVALAIEWVLTELLRSPENMKRVQDELASVVGLDQWRMEDTHLEKLTFLKCTLKEALRLHPPFPLLLHETVEDAEVTGYFIPKGSRVMVNTSALGRDPDSWSDPEIFNPGRFLDPDAPDLRGNNFEFIPFGSGRRSCPGMQLGVYAFELAVAHLLLCFTWSLPDGMKSSDVDTVEGPGLTVPKATPLVAVPTTRLLCPIVS